MFRKNAGRLLIVVVGGGCLAALFFVVLPMISEPVAPVTRDAIVGQGLGSGAPVSDEGDLEAVMPSPLVGVWNDGKEVAVNFQAAEPVAEGSPVSAEESRVDDGGLLQALSADDVAAARAALQGWEAGPVAPAEDMVAELAEAAGAVRAGSPQTGVPVDPGGSGDLALLPADSEAPAAARVPRVARVAEGKTAGDEPPVVPASEAEITERETAPAEPPKVEAVTLPVEIVLTNDTGMPTVVEVHGQRRVQFDLPVPPDSRTPLEVSHPSGGIATTVAAQAGNPGLSPRPVGAGTVVPGTLRGVMGYRLPLVGRQEVPDQIVSGVLIPAHTTFVILKAGSWELMDVTPEELERLREAAAGREAPATEVEPAKKGWNPLRIFRKRAAPDHE